MFVTYVVVFVFVVFTFIRGGQLLHCIDYVSASLTRRVSWGCEGAAFY
jgi:hypothetical protein